jgi:hypothetical protein
VTLIIYLGCNWLSKKFYARHPEISLLKKKKIEQKENKNRLSKREKPSAKAEIDLNTACGRLTKIEKEVQRPKSQANFDELKGEEEENSGEEEDQPDGDRSRTFRKRLNTLGLRLKI